MLMVRELPREEILTIIENSYLGPDPSWASIAEVVEKCFQAAIIQQDKGETRGPT